jgi:O-antigen/teichoic acid export membrane protein
MKRLIQKHGEKLIEKIERYVKTDIRYLLHGGFWIMAGKGIIFFTSFLILLAFSHWATKDVYGTYQYMLAVMGVASIATLPGMDIALVKSIAQGKEGSFEQAISARLRFSTIGSVCLFIVSAYYCTHHNLILGSIFFATAVFLPFMQSFDSFEYFWNGRGDFKRAMWYIVYATSIPALVLVATIALTSNIIIITAVVLAANTLARWIAVLTTRTHVQNSVQDPHIVPLGKSLTMVQGVDMIAGYIDKIFLWKFTTPVAVAIYSFAQIPILKAQQLTPIQMLALPKLSNKNIFEAKSNILGKFFKLFLVTIPVTIFVLAVAPFFFKWFFPQYIEALPYFDALSLIVILGPFALLNSALITAVKRREIVGIQTAALIARITLFLILVPRFGIWGTVYGVVTTELFKDLLIVYFFWQIEPTASYSA